MRASEAPPGFPTRAERARERERKVAQRREVLSKHPLVYGVVTAKPQRGSCNEGVLCGGMLLVFKFGVFCGCVGGKKRFCKLVEDGDFFRVIFEKKK